MAGGPLIVIPPGSGEVLGDAPDRRVEVLSDVDALHATWSRFGPRREGADLHIHHHHTDCFYVLDGELTVRLGMQDEQIHVLPGTLVRVPPYVVHGFRNSSDEEVRYLNLHAPGMGFNDFMRGIRDHKRFDWDQHDPPADGGRSPADAEIGTDGGSVLSDAPELHVQEVHGTPPDGDGRLRSLYVLEGEVTIAVGDDRRRAQAGAWAQIAAGTEHTMWCDGATRLLDIRA